ncbi:phosphoglycerate mutase-like protein [Crucibulum laeve]|uniref:Phytase A n=1 Tax=Crucibulum laeve TaxID=68775 RepID=A0A5C3LKP9_9AGAR|nr:phosphoglycerate mutase-like protein [Crucibulum laeve]
MRISSDGKGGPVWLTSKEMQMTWAMYTPYFPAEEYVKPPSNCGITQINIIQRHGARFPTVKANEAAGITSALKKLQSVSRYTDPKFGFLKNYTYALGTDELVPLGALQSMESGNITALRYPELVSLDDLPFVRSSSSQRVVDSATNWTSGWFHATGERPPISVILLEDRNDTLEDNMCPNAGSSTTQTTAWIDVFTPPTAKRLNSKAPGANLTGQDVYSLMSLCPLDTVAKEKLSPICGLFTVDEFRQFEYVGDLDKYYSTGYGQPLGPVQGVGYVNELLARLTGTPVRDNTQTNRTLDSSPITFPLNRTIYVDFSHEHPLAAIYSAIGLFKQPAPLNPTQPDPDRSWLASRMVPFSARMVTEKLVCGDEKGKGKGKKKEYVRILVNDALQPLKFCGAGDDGLCELKAFVESQAYARTDGAGDFEKCYD